MQKFMTFTAIFLSATCALLAGMVQANDYPMGERSIFSEKRTQERLAPVGQVCVEGQECTKAVATSVAQASATQEALTPEGIYSSKCQACHNSGMMGAPKPGDQIWQTMIDERGLDMIVQNAINGINSMPPKGMCGDCTDDDIRATVEYMVSFGK